MSPTTGEFAGGFLNGSRSTSYLMKVEISLTKIASFLLQQKSIGQRCCD